MGKLSKLLWNRTYPRHYFMPDGDMFWPRSGNHTQEEIRLAWEPYRFRTRQKMREWTDWDYIRFCFKWWRIHDLPPLLRHPLIVATYTAVIGAAVTKLVGIW